MKFFDRVRVGTTTTGQGTITLGSAADGDMMSFTEAGAADGDQITYILTEGQDFEVGRGTLGGDVTTMTRDTVLVSKISGSVGTGKMELAGTAVVTNVYGAVDANRMLALAGRHASMGEVVKNAGWSVAASDAGSMLVYNSTSGGTAALPAVASSGGEVYYFRALNTGALTIDPNGGEQIEGAATLVLPQGRSAIVWPNEGKTAWRAAILLAHSDAALGLVVRGDAAQSLSVAQKAQAQVNIGALGASIATKSADYTVTTGDAGAVISVDANGAARTITLPSAVSAGAGFKVSIKKSDSSYNTVTIDGDGSETIDGAATKVLRLPFQSATIICDGSGWKILDEAGTALRGSDANGEWERHANGTQSCLCLAAANQTADQAHGNGFRAAADVGFTYPVPFASAPFVAPASRYVSGPGHWMVPINGGGTGGCSGRIYSFVTGAVGTPGVIATGRWY